MESKLQRQLELFPVLLPFGQLSDSSLNCPAKYFDKSRFSSQDIRQLLHKIHSLTKDSGLGTTDLGLRTPDSARLPVRHSRKKIHNNERSQLARLSVDVEFRIDLNDVDRFYPLAKAGKMGCLQ